MTFRKTIVIAFLAILLHIIFIVISFDAGFLSFFEDYVDPVIIERTFMFLQFLPLILVLVDSKLSRSKVLVFLTFAICISTLFIIDDFNTGFFGAAVDYDAGIMPRMRASAHLMAYEDTGRLVTLDYHGDYMLEFALDYFLSEIAGLNYILTYFFLVRIIMILLFSFVFVWSSTLATGYGRRAVTLLLAASILLASQSYNHEMSFAPVLLLLFYLIARKQQRKFVFISLFILLAVLLASFRETLLLGLVSLSTLCVIPWNKASKNMHSGSYLSSTFANFMILVLVSARVLLLASIEYFQGYAARFLSLIDSIVTVFKEGLGFQEAPLTTLATIQNPFDTAIALLSVVFAVGIMILIGILSILFILSRKGTPFSIGLSFVYILALSLPLMAYMVDKITGSGPLHDFGSNTVLARSLLPITIIVIMPYIQRIKKVHFLSKKPLSVLMIVCISIALIFAPFLFARREVKSTFDMQRVSGDLSDYIILGNNMYEFTLSNAPYESQIRILSPASGILQHYYLSPLEYNTGKQIERGAINITLESRIFDNGLYVISTYDSSTLFLNETTSIIK